MCSDMMSIRKIAFALVMVISIVKGDFNLTIIHVNDIHARFLETDTYSGTCKDKITQGNFKLLLAFKEIYLMECLFRMLWRSCKVAKGCQGRPKS